MSDAPAPNTPYPSSASPRNSIRKLPLHTRIFIGLAIGVVAGVGVNRVFGGGHAAVLWILSNVTEPVGQLFLRVLLMTVIPLVFSSLVVGVAGLGDVRKLGRVGLKSFAYCAVISAISVVIGLVLVNVIKPGKRIDPATAAGLQERYGADARKKVEEARKAGTTDSVAMQVIKTLVPVNPITAVASETPNMLHLMFFAVLFGVAMTLAGAERTTTRCG